MAKAKKIRRQQRMSRLQEKLLASGQIKTQQDNSTLIQQMAEMDKVVEATPVEEITNEQIEKMTDTIEMMIEEVIEAKEVNPILEQVTEPMNLSKLRKAELLQMAKAMNCKVTSKYTKRQIIETIEKQST